MASLPPPTTAAAAAEYSSTLSPKKSQFTINGKRNHAYKVSCRATDANQNPSPQNEETSSPVKFNRRNALLGLGAVYGAANLSLDPLALSIAAETSTANVVFPQTLDKVVKVTIQRPKKSRSLKEKEEEEEILVIYGIEMERDVFVKFDVYVNEEDEAASGADKAEFAGSFANVPHRGKDGKKMKTSLKLGLSELLENLGAEDDESVLVSLVPRAGIGLVSIGGVNIELAS